MRPCTCARCKGRPNRFAGEKARAKARRFAQERAEAAQRLAKAYALSRYKEAAEYAAIRRTMVTP